MRMYDEIAKDLHEISAENYTEKALLLLDDVKEYNTALEALKAINSENESKLAELRDINAKLYLRATDEVTTQTEEDEVTVEDIVKEMKG